MKPLVSCLSVVVLFYLSLSEGKIVTGPPQSVYLFQNLPPAHANGFSIQQIDIDTAKVISQHNFTAGPVVAGKIWRINSTHVAFMTENYPPATRMITVLNIQSMTIQTTVGFNDQCGRDAYCTHWHTSVYDPSTRKVFLFQTGISFVRIADFDPLTGTLGELRVNVSGGVPAYDGSYLMLDSAGRKLYLIGWYNGFERRSAARSQTRENFCISGCAFIYTIDLKTGVQTSVQEVENLFYWTAPIAAIYDPTKNRVVAFDTSSGPLRSFIIDPTTGSYYFENQNIIASQCLFGPAAYANDGTTNQYIFAYTTCPTQNGPMGVYMVRYDFDTKKTQIQQWNGVSKNAYYGFTAFLL